jgi:phosphate:Na+ symporter
VMRALFAAITGMPLLDLLFGAALAWAAHSSVAVVLLVMSLAYSNFIAVPATLAFVLGANLGSAINPLIEGSALKNPVARRLPLGNLINRVVGCTLALPVLTPIGAVLEKLDQNSVRLIADFHTLFNVALALLFIGVLPNFARLIRWLLPQPETRPDPSVPIYLDPAAVSTPSLGLTCAERETLHMGDLVEKMLRQSIDALITSDRKLVTVIEDMDDSVDKLHEAIKFYITQITRESLDESEAKRAMEIIAFAINLEHIGDIIDKNLMELAAKKIRSHFKFSEEGAAELQDFHRRIVDGLKLAQSVFMSSDTKIARQLVAEKVVIREAERTAAENHFTRLRAGHTASIETSSLHLDILRDLKRVYSHVCATAYPILEATGELQPTRLKSADVGLLQ